MTEQLFELLRDRLGYRISNLQALTDPDHVSLGPDQQEAIARWIALEEYKEFTGAQESAGIER